MESLRGDESRISKFSAAREIADYMKMTLGPNSLQKVIMLSDASFILTSDGKTILQRFDLQEFRAKHPVAQLFVELCKTMDYEMGDGTTSAVVLAGELLKNAERLIDEGLNPIIIDDGYKKATRVAIELIESIALTADDDMVRRAARTAFCTKYVSDDIPDVVVDAVRMTEENGKVDPEMVHVVKKAGEDMSSTKLFNGFIIEKEILHASMPKRIEDARVAVLDIPITVKRYDGLFGDAPGGQCTVRIDDVGQRSVQRENEDAIIGKIIGKIEEVGANFVVSRKRVDVRIGKRFADAGIAVVHYLPTKEDLEKLSKACGARIISDIDSLREEDLGFASLVEERRYADRTVHIFVETKNARSATVLIRGVQRILTDLSRAVHDAVWSTANVINGKIIPGGGATEMFLSMELRRYALSVKTKKQLAINAFADALEVIPRTLAKNCGLDPISAILELRKVHREGKLYHGIDSITKRITDVLEEGIIEPSETKIRILKGSSETSRTIILSDDIVHGEVLQERIEEESKLYGR